MRLRILQYGSPVLRAKGRRVEKIDENIRQLAADMIDTMHAANGVGLAAQQIGQALQLTVIDVSQVEDRPSTLKLNGRFVDPKAASPLVLINPEIVLGDETSIGVEGCLSFPEITGDIERAEMVRARAQALDGSEIDLEASGLFARALQHEVDHLNGILFIDRMNSAAKTALASRLKKMQKETERATRQNRQSVETEPAL
ncbi:MAG: peptide deformylase [Chthoniobacterales bacterium]